MNCPRMAIALPAITATSIPGFRRSDQAPLVSPFKDALVTSISSLTSSGVEYILLRTVDALSVFPFTISHLGLSGIKNMMKKNRSAGMVSLPSMPLHASVCITFCQSVISPAPSVALSAIEGSMFASMIQFIRYARRNPMVTASW